MRPEQRESVVRDLYWTIRELEFALRYQPINDMTRSAIYKCINELRQIVACVQK